MADVEAVVCGKEGCRVAETGKCLEGLPVEQCPHRVSKGKTQPSDAGKEAVPQEPTSASPKVLDLPYGELLNPDGVVSLLRTKGCRVIALIGPNDAGKTTLVISLYEMFQQGPYGCFRFSGSHTLYDFEQVCHLGRAVSRRTISRTERTSRAAGLKFFHLELSNELSGGNIDFLFSERAGEDYRSAADDPTVVSDFPEIRRADCVSIVVDGNRLIDIGARHNVKSDAVLILQGLVDGNALRPEQRLAVVLTKYDRILKSSAVDRANGDFAGLVDKIKALFGKYVSEVEEFQTAARPDTSEIPRGFGLGDLLQFWARPIYILPHQWKHTLSPRAFGRFNL